MQTFFNGNRSFPFNLLAILSLLAGLACSAQPVRAAANGCSTGQFDSGAYYQICLPPNWNGDVLLYAHGYTAFNQPLAVPSTQLTLNGTSITSLVAHSGYAFAATSYRSNGLAVLDGVADMVDLARRFRALHPDTRHVYLAGVSEGGLVAALAVEQYPEVFSGGLSMCGPVGDFRRQVDYWGDFRVLFDAYFPGLLPGSAMEIPAEVLSGFHSIYWPRAATALRADPVRARQLLDAAGAAYDPRRPETAGQTVYSLLWYSVFATNNGRQVLGGQPYANEERDFSSSDLNTRVERFSADPAALAKMSARYQTTGKLSVPLVTLHTTLDPVVPYFHQQVYEQRVQAQPSAKYASFTVQRYGHCDFRADEVLAAFWTLVYNVTGDTPGPGLAR